MDSELEKANARLKAAHIGIAIVKRGSKLSLVGTLPCKDGSLKKQQRIALDVYANPAGIKRAFEEAKKVSAALALKEFDWSLYGGGSTKAKTVGDWLEQFERDYFTRRARTPKSETTWKTDYISFFNRLPIDIKLTASLLMDAIALSPPDTKSRKRYCVAASALARFAKIEFDARAYVGNYSVRRLKPRTLPTDEQIIEWRERITDERWQYVFGLMACYGLRNHEVFNLDLESLKDAPGILTVLDGKSGTSRRVWPCHHRWWDEWHLWDIGLMPTANGKNNSILGARVTKKFKKYGILNPYNLRHAWAVRTLELGLDVSLAAQQMGHSLKIHCDIYHHWVSDRTHQKAFDELMARDRKD